MYVCKFICLT